MPTLPYAAARLGRWFAVLLLAGCAVSHQAPAASGGSQEQEPSVAALQRAHAAVVGVLVNAIAEARSTESLGRQRSGSGVVIGPDGLVLTIGYLLLEAENIQVVTQDGRTLPARTVAYDLATGFGLLRPLLPLRGIASVPLGSIEGLAPGDALMVVTGGEDADIALTHVVGKRPFSGYWEYHIEAALFTSPPVAHHGGAAVFNRRGELLGVGSLFVGDATGSGRRMPGNLFVPVDLLKPILTELQRTGTTRQSRRPWLGLNSIEREGRVHVLRVSQESPAQAAGLRPGDVVLAVDDTRVATLEAFYKKLWDRGSPDADVRLTVQRAEEIRDVTVRAVDRMSTLARPAGI